MLEQDAEAIRRKAEEADKTPVYIALFGQPGSGKSSLINAIVGQPIAEVGQENDVTTARADYQWNSLFLTDLPGYGTAEYPAVTYFSQFEIEKFDIFLCVSSGKLKDDDIKFFNALVSAGKHCIFVYNKADAIKQKGLTIDKLKEKIVNNLRNKIKSDLSVFFTSCIDGEGMDALIREIMRILPSMKKDRFARSAAAYSKEFLEEKKKACLSYALYSAWVSVTVNIVPIPGLGISADVANIIISMERIRSDFHLTAARMDNFANIMPNIAPVISSVLNYATKEGAALVLNRMAASGALVEATKYIPAVGTVAAGTISFGAIYFVLKLYIDDCYKIADEMLKSHF